MARLGSKRVAEDFSNSGLADVLEYLYRKGWYEVGTPVTAEGFKECQFEVNRGLLDRLVERILATGDAQSKLDFSNLRQWVRNHRRNSFKEVSGISSLSCDLSQQAYGNLLKLVNRTGRSQRSVVENLLLDGDTTLRGEIKLLRDEKRGQSKKLQDREGRAQKKEERLKLREESLECQEKQLADFKRHAQPFLDLLRDVGNEGNANFISAFKSILEALREIGKKEGCDLLVRDTTSELKPGRYSEEEKTLSFQLLILMNAMIVRDEEV